MAWMDARISSCNSPGTAASGGREQYTVLRIFIGGSTGLRMMMALPFLAPPTTSQALAVVSVNSSTFARVPGPAEREEIDATISAYSTGTMRLTAETIGVVACPPQVIRLTLSTASSSSRFTDGQQYGPTAAGVRSIAWMPASRSEERRVGKEDRRG